VANELPPIDLTASHDILLLAKEVRRSGKARVLRRGDEDVAILSPIRPKTKRHARKPKTFSAADDAAFLSAAGAWKDFDLDEFLRANEESRRSSRPPVHL
jgi:hypothetical protein